MSVAGASSSSEAWLAGSEAWLVVSASAAAAAGEASTLGTRRHGSPQVGLWTAPVAPAPARLLSSHQEVITETKDSKPNKTNPHPQIPLRQGWGGFAHPLTGEPLPTPAQAHTRVGRCASPLTRWVTLKVLSHR